MTRKCRRPSRTKSQLQAQAEEDGASVDGAEPRADVEAVKAEVEATEQVYSFEKRSQGVQQLTKDRIISKSPQTQRRTYVGPRRRS